MPWNIILVPAIAAVAYGFLLGLNSRESYYQQLKNQKERKDENSN